MFHSHSILKSTFPTPLKLQKFSTKMNLNEGVCIVCVLRFGVFFTYVIESIDWKLISVISVCSINDYSLIP